MTKSLSFCETILALDILTVATTIPSLDCAKVVLEKIMLNTNMKRNRIDSFFIFNDKLI
jgi:hypothetical protein